MADIDPGDPDLMRWLASLGSEREFVLRLAMRQVFDRCRRDRAWSARIGTLMDEINPGEWKFARLMKQAEKATGMVRDVDAAATIGEAMSSR